MPEENVKEELNPAVVMQEISKLPGAPTEDQIKSWKTEYKAGIFISAMDAEEVYIFRPLMRKEYKAIQQEQAELQAKAQQQNIPIPAGWFEEKVIATCLLWASQKDALELKGGSVEAVLEQIMSRSNFMNPGVAAQLVVKL